MVAELMSAQLSDYLDNLVPPRPAEMERMEAYAGRAFLERLPSYLRLNGLEAIQEEITMLIRRVKPEDGEAIWRITIQSTRELTATHYSSEQVEASVRLIGMAHSPFPIFDDQPIFVAEDPPGNPIGFSQLNLTEARVEAVFVHPEHIRRGVGTRLLLALEETAREAGLTELYLDANLNAVAFYEHAGYQVEELMTPKIDGVDYPVMVMRKALAASAELEVA